MERATIGVVGTYPPTYCGIASFSAALVDALGKRRGTRRGIGVVRLGDGVGPEPIEVVGRLEPDDPRSLSRAAGILNGYDAVILQHEYGIYGADSGAAVLDLVERVDSPTLVTYHTVLAAPSPQQRLVLQRLAELTSVSVVMSRGAAKRIIDVYGVDAEKIWVIPHGANGFLDAGRSSRSAPFVLTWGLVGPGKGLEWAIEAMARLPGVRYVIAGRTHPKVAAHEGEAYRQRLQRQVRALGLQNRVEFVSHYLDRTELSRLVRGAGVILLPYETTEQVTSGVLVDAIASMVPVVATRFPHAVELAQEGAVVAVPHRDSEAMANAVWNVLHSPQLRAKMAPPQARLAESFKWEKAASSYLQALDFMAEEAVDAVVA